MFYLSRLGVNFALLGFFLYLVSLQSRSGLLFLILGVLGGCFIVNLLEARRAARHLRLVPPDSIWCSEGEPVRGSWEIENLSSRAMGLAEIVLPAKPHERLDQRLLAALGGRLPGRLANWLEAQTGDGPRAQRVLLRIGAVPAGGKAFLTPDLVLPRRGVYAFANLRLISSYPFGLVRWARGLDVTGEILVFPAVYACAAPPAAGFEPMVGGKFTGKNRSASGDSFHGVRPMHPGDPVRLIHWPSTAKGQGLMVREYDEELSGRLAIFLDCSPGEAPNGELCLDWAARCAASLMLAALDAGHQVEFRDLAGGETLSVPPFADGSEVLGKLARALPVQACREPANLAHAVAAVPRQAALCFVLAASDPDFEDFVHDHLLAASRRVALYLPAGAPAPNLPGVQVKFYGERAIVGE